MKNTKKWYTFVELIVVITIISLMVWLSMKLIPWKENITYEWAKITLWWLSLWLNNFSLQERDYPKPYDDKWNVSVHWVIWYLNTKAQIDWTEDLDIDEYWNFMYRWNYIYYVTSDTWSSYNIWIKTKAYAAWRVHDIFLIDWRQLWINLSYESLFWLKSWTTRLNELKVISTKDDLDNNNNWIVEFNETQAQFNNIFE